MKTKETEILIYLLKQHKYLYNSHSSKAACIHTVARLYHIYWSETFSDIVICLGWKVDIVEEACLFWIFEYEKE